MKNYFNSQYGTSTLGGGGSGSLMGTQNQSQATPTLSQSNAFGYQKQYQQQPPSPKRFEAVKNNYIQEGGAYGKQQMDPQYNEEMIKQSQLEALDSRINTVNTRIQEAQDIFSKRFNSVKEQINLISQFIDEDKQYKEQLAEIRSQEFRILEQKVFERFDQEANQRKELEKKVLQLIDQRVNNLRTDIARESKTRYESIEHLENCLEGDFPKLQEEIRNEANEREEFDNIIIKKTNEESAKLVESIQSEKKAREETEESILELLRDMVNRIKNELESEKKERESSEETLLQLLEETCTKLNTATII